MPHVAGLAHHAPPGRELQQNPVRVLEVERPDEDTGVQLRGHAELAVVVVDDRADPHALGLELGPVLEELLLGHVEGDVVHRADRARPLAEAGNGDRSRDARHGVGRVREPEERERVAAAHVEEEVLARTARQVDRLDQPHAEHAGVELDGALHVRADERQVVDAAEAEFLVLPLHLLASLVPTWCGQITKSKLSFTPAPGLEAAHERHRQGVRRAAVTGHRPGRSRRPPVPGHLSPPGRRRAEDGLHRHALQRRLLRALPGLVHGRARLRLPGLEHALPRERGPFPARPRAGRDRRGRPVAARAGRSRAHRAARQLRRRLPDGGLSVAGHRAERQAGRRDAAAGRDRGPARRRPVRRAGRPLRAARGTDQLARSLGDRRDRPARRRPGPRPVQPRERPAVQRRNSSGATGPRSATGTSGSPTGPWTSWPRWTGPGPGTACSTCTGPGPTCG